MEEGVRILVAYDGSDESKKAVEEAKSIAEKFKGSIDVLNVYWDAKETQYENTLARTENITPSDEGSLRILDDAEEILVKSGVNYTLRTVRDSDVAGAILRVVEEEGIDCIVMGSRGLGRSSALILGSVSTSVIAKAECPVIVT